MIFVCTVSFHKIEEGGLSFQVPCPPTPHPDDLMSASELIRKHLADENISPTQKQQLERRLSDEVPVEIRSPNRHGKTDPTDTVFMRVVGKLGDDPSLHQCAAAYCSDWSLLGTALHPFPDFEVGIVASLDHTIWFHAPFRADEWMLYHKEVTRSAGNRSLCFGRIYTPDGTLAVSVAQEGLIRPRLTPKAAAKAKL